MTATLQQCALYRSLTRGKTAYTGAAYRREFLEAVKEFLRITKALYHAAVRTSDARFVAKSQPSGWQSFARHVRDDGGRCEERDHRIPGRTEICDSRSCSRVI